MFDKPIDGAYYSCDGDFSFFMKNDKMKKIWKEIRCGKKRMKNQ